MIPYSFDGTAALKQRPEAVVFPRTTEQVPQCVRLAAAARMPIVTRGSGTGLSGGSVPSPGCLVLCLAQMNAILDVDPRNLTLRAQPGAITQRIDEAAARHGLFYPPDPGLDADQHHRRQRRRELRRAARAEVRRHARLRDGARGRARRRPRSRGSAAQCVKDVAGYSLKDLFIGSEGTLGIITEVLLKLVPRPAARRTMLALYDRIEDAAETVSAIIAARIIPCTLEFLDRMTAGCVEDYAHVGLPTDCEAVLLMETDGHPAAVADESRPDGGASRARTAPATCARRATRPRRCSWRRRAATPSPRWRAGGRRRSSRTSPCRAASWRRWCASSPTRRAAFNLQIGTFGHMGDGNLHPTFLTDERDADEMHRVHQALDAIVTRTLELGGTITGEHGVGLAKKPWLRQQMGDAQLRADAAGQARARSGTGC